MAPPTHETGTKGLIGQWKPVRRSVGFYVSLLLVSLMMLLIPVIYLAMIGAVGWGVWLAHCLFSRRSRRGAAPRRSASGG